MENVAPYPAPAVFKIGRKKTLLQFKFNYAQAWHRVIRYQGVTFWWRSDLSTKNLAWYSNAQAVVDGCDVFEINSTNQEA